MHLEDGRLGEPGVMHHSPRSLEKAARLQGRALRLIELVSHRDVKRSRDYGHILAEDWWTVVLGSGYRWTVEQMSDGERARVRAANLKTLRDSGTISIETNVIYAVAQKV